MVGKERPTRVLAVEGKEKGLAGGKAVLADFLAGEEEGLEAFW